VIKRGGGEVTGWIDEELGAGMITHGEKTEKSDTEDKRKEGEEM